MQIFTQINDIQTALGFLKKETQTIGFVPTMGALHEGHLSLIEKAKPENDIVVCSIFVNPVQFNNKEDFDKYPVQDDVDIELLKKYACDILFIPTVKEMYPEAPKQTFSFGQLENVMEGAFRPRHFNGVAIIVKKLFEIICPDKAYFGEKDFQQLMIILALVKQLNLDIEIVPCPIIREADGLAMSSRNVRLTEHQRAVAPQIYTLLRKCVERSAFASVAEVKAEFIAKIIAFPEFKLDYFEIADENSLQPISGWDDSKNPRAFAAIFMDNVRLIDNMNFFCNFAKS